MTQSTIGKYRWTICALLFFATTINYLDRQVLSLLKPVLEKDFGWNNSDYANIAATFQFVYAVALIIAGRVVDKLDTRWGYAWAIIIWSVGAVIHALAIPIGNAIVSIGFTVFSFSVIGFMFARTILALGEAGNFPAAIKATAEYFPKKERSFATGIFNSGANVGAVLAPLTVIPMTEMWGWESTFIVIGAFGFIWLFFWLAMYKKPHQQKRLSAEELAYINSDTDDNLASVGNAIPANAKVSWTKLLTYNQTWAFAFGKFMTDGVWWFFLFWLPAYLSDQHHMTSLEMVWPLAILYTITGIGSVSGGWFPMYFIRKGYTPYDGRMKAMLVIALIPLVVLLAQPFGDSTYWVAVVLVGIGTAAHQAWSANIFTTVSDMFPKKAIGSVVGIGGFAGGIGGVLMTKMGGAFFDHYKALGHIKTGYTIMFTICALAYLVAWIVMKTLVPKYKPITDL